MEGVPVSNNIKALNDIAQRLDELADDGPDELTVIAEELGQVADRLQNQIEQLDLRLAKSPRDDLPRYLREINSIVQREVSGAFRMRGLPDDMLAAEYYRYQMERDMSRSLPSVKSVLGGISGI
jgi:hypothetical protein